MSQGFLLFNENRLEEAMAVADQTAKMDPTSSEPLSLKAMIYEHQGSIAEALQFYERVLELNPDSALDQIKVNQLRNKLADKLAEEPEPKHAIPIAMGLAALALFIIVGAIVANFLHGSGKTATIVASNDSPKMSAYKAEDPAGVSAPVKPAPTQTANPQADRGNPTVLQASHPDAKEDPQNADATKPEGSDAKLPGITDQAITPYTPPLKITPDSAAQPKSKDPDPAPTPAKSQDTTSAVKTPEEPSVIEISVSNPQKRPIGGSDPVSQGAGANELEVVKKMATAQFQLRHYDSAAKAYNRLLKLGGNPISTNQRLGQCYENLGQSSEAVSSYQRAISAIRASLSSGKGDASRLNAALASCEQAIKVLQGS